MGVDLPSLLNIKIKYRTALTVAYLRDYSGAAQILKDLKKFCNVYEQFDLFDESNKLLSLV